MELQYSDIQKAAIVCALVEMVNVDLKVTEEELRETNIINQELNVTDEIFELGVVMPVDHALRVIRKMNDEQKMNVAKLLVRIIDSDDEVANSEIVLLNEICSLTGIDLLFELRVKDAPEPKASTTTKPPREDGSEQ